MKKRNLTRGCAVLLTLTMLALAGCGGGKGAATAESQGGQNSPAATEAAGGGESAKSKDFVYCCGTEPTTLDPHLINDNATARAAFQIYETLVYRDTDSSIKPRLAESWTTSDDGTVWTFKLRQGVKFHDGETFNAEAVKYNIERLKNPETAAPKASVVDMVKSVDVVDEYTVAFTLSEPSSVFLAQISSYTTGMLSPKSAESQGKEFGQHPVGTGPLKLESWDYGSSLVMTRFDDYWGEKATVDSITFRIVPEDASRVMMLKTGDADLVAGIPPVQIEELQSDPNVKVLVETGYRTIFLGMNSTVKPLDDVRVRQAVNYAIDRESIIKNVMRDVASYPDSFMVSNVIDNSAKGLGCYEFDQEKAKALLAEAGYVDGFTLTLSTPEGRYAMDRQVAEVIQAMLMEVGITAEINVLDWGAYSEQATSGQHQFFLLGMGCPTGDPEFNLFMNFGTEGPQNYSRFSNATVDQLLAEQSTILDAEERSKVMYRIQEELKNDACGAPLYYEQQTYGSGADVNGFIIYPDENASMAYLVRE